MMQQKNSNLDWVTFDRVDEESFNQKTIAWNNKTLIVVTLVLNITIGFIVGLIAAKVLITVSIILNDNLKDKGKHTFQYARKEKA